MNRHTIQELYQWQALPLNIKIRMTKRRIRDWVDEYGEDGVYVSFSGGKDSTVLLHIAREMYPDIKAVFVDTGLEYPEIRSFVKTFDNIDWLRPKKHFKQVIEKYGYPFISKDVSGAVGETLSFVRKVERERGITIPQGETLEFLQTSYGKGENFGYQRRMPVRTLQMIGKMPHKNPDEFSKMYNKSKWNFLLDAPFKVSNRCCWIMKKSPLHEYEKRTGRKARITGTMAEESLMRQAQWLSHGCNSFEGNHPSSNPMSFWTEQDVLLYIKSKNIPIATVYGDVVTDTEKTEQIDGQLSISDLLGESEVDKFAQERTPLKTTGCTRTGCVFCGFGCHLEKGEGRFVRLKRTHPKHYKAMANIKNNGVNYFEAIDWINEHNGKGEIIKMPRREDDE